MIEFDLYDEKYVYIDIDSCKDIIGKLGFGADNIRMLKDCVKHDIETNSYYPCSYSGDVERPFHLQTGENVRFFYYDPHYEIKRAYLDGKEIQIKINDNWHDVSDDFVFMAFLDNTKLRIKPKEESLIMYKVLFNCDTKKFVTVSDNLIIHNYFSSDVFDECKKWILDHLWLENILSAWVDGYKIEVKIDGEWKDYKLEYDNEIDTIFQWHDDYEYRIKPSTLMTIPNYTTQENAKPNIIHTEDGEYLELNGAKIDKETALKFGIIKQAETTPRWLTNYEFSKWMSKGKGQYKFKNLEHIYSGFWDYKEGTEDLSVKSYLLVRKWDDKCWHEPTTNYISLDEIEE